MTRTVTLTLGDQTIELPVIEGTEGELALDISSLRAKTSLITFDPGFGTTGFLPRRDHLLRRRKRNPAVPRHSDRAACRTVELRRNRVLAHPRPPAFTRRTGQFREKAGHERPASRILQAPFRWLSG